MAKTALAALSWMVALNLLELAPQAWARDAAAGGALEAVAQEATQSLGQTPVSSVVVAAPPVSDERLVRGEELAGRIAELVATRLGSRSRPHPQPASLATARALAGRASALVYVGIEVSRGDLRLTLDVYPSMANAWDRIRSPLSSPSAHAFASAKIDAEVRSFLVPLLLEQASVSRAHHDEGDVLAAACGDVDGDGGDELVLVSRARIAMGRVRAGKFMPERTAAWSAIAPRTAVPMREPLAGAVVAPGTVDVGSSDRGAFSLTPDFAGHVALSGVPAWGGDRAVCLLAEPSAGAFDGAPIDCVVARDPRAAMTVPAPRFDAFACATYVDPAGEPHSLLVVREPSGKLKLRVDDISVRGMDGPFGAQLAVGDLDQDGTPEVVTTNDGPDDAVNVLTWNEALASGAAPSSAEGGAGGTGVQSALVPRLHLPAPGGVRALAICPAEQGGEPVLTAVVGDEVWLVRAQPSPGEKAGNE
jgi:hypothetical protein